MRLESTQRHFTDLCFSRQPREQDLASLGGRRDRWVLYRTMVRQRLLRMLESGLPRTVQNLDAELWLEITQAWLDEDPPTTRFIRDVVPAFVAHFDRQPTHPLEPRWLRDALHYECARWTASYDVRPVDGDPATFSFDLPALINPTVRLLVVEHRVHQSPTDGFADGKTYLAVYRRRNDRVAALTLAERTHAWLDALRSSDGKTSETIQNVARKRRETIDAAYVEALGTSLATLVEQDIVLGGKLT